MVEEDLGRATLVYENADGDTVETTVRNEHLVYVQDHWLLDVSDEEAGTDTVRRIPIQRVYHVEREVEAFEDELSTLRGRVESVADDVRDRLLGGDGEEDDTGEESDAVHIDVEEADDVDR
ncbi:hypothetical protein J2752_000674 [Halarchaeum rubridurum]|uniref:Uncharacterized protein n=1 Tax=Halarchaeum rubridurum TaxID=489911 RepID=A0A830FK08_9EURY|nr:hypothetical protein [Halarchaeum rubridurum]MBP1953793.1 hypothetical protein [Halarchaeum rubridurum]GGM54701.1 hypothetical protein GCM10009017_01330 [Halarchaeum rubridurum]